MTQNGVRPSTSPEADDKRARYDALVTDLEDEIAELDALLVGLRPDQWRYDTQSRGWSVAHQIGHLELTETLMYTAITDEDTFRVLALSSRTKPEISDVDFANADLGKKQRARWTRSRGDLLDEFRKADPSTRMPWVGVSMSMTSAVTARIMEASG